MNKVLKRAFACGALAMAMSGVAMANSYEYSGTGSCSKGNFTGSVKYTYKWSVSDKIGRWNIKEYKIYASKDSGRSKANVNTFISQDYGKDSTSIKSSDSMKQDNSWRSLNHSANIRFAHMASFTYADVEFVFDKSGSDPKCKIRLDAGLQPGQ